MKEKLIIIKDKLIVVKDVVKNFLIRAASAVKKLFLYSKNMMKYAVPLLGIIIILLVMLIVVGWKNHVLELEKAMQKAQVITEYFVAEELKNISEFNTQEYTYTIERSTSKSRRVFNLDVPLTEKTLSVLYSGEVEIGYNIGDISYKAIGNKVWLDFPEPIVENYITKEVVRDEDNNIFNPINAEDYAILRDSVLDEGLKKAVDKGSYEAAEANLKSILKTHFEKLGYSVTFI